MRDRFSRAGNRSGTDTLIQAIGYTSDIGIDSLFFDDNSLILAGTMPYLQGANDRVEIKRHIHARFFILSSTYGRRYINSQFRYNTGRRGSAAASRDYKRNSKKIQLSLWEIFYRTKRNAIKSYKSSGDRWTQDVQKL